MKRVLLLLLFACLLLSSCRPLNNGTSDVTEKLETEAETEAPVPKFERDTDGRLVVMVDAGHGFDDVGCTSKYINCYEKDINLQVALKLKAELEEMGVEVILTHDGKTFVDEDELAADCKSLGISFKSEGVTNNDNFYAYERALLAQVEDKRVGVDLFISLHVNALEKENVSGYQIFYCTDNPLKKRVKALCEDIAEGLDNKCDVIGYPYEDAYIVTKFGTFPSLLLEMGYATNPDDAKKLVDEEFQSTLAELLSEKIYTFVAAAAEK